MPDGQAARRAKITQGLIARRRARAEQKRVQKRAKLGTGARFRAVEKAAAAGGARDPAAVAAAIGRKKFGKKKFQAMAARGRKKG